MRQCSAAESLLLGWCCSDDASSGDEDEDREGRAKRLHRLRETDANMAAIECLSAEGVHLRNRSIAFQWLPKQFLPIVYWQAQA